MAEAHKGIREVYGVNCLTERTVRICLKNFVLEISHRKMTKVLVDLLKSMMT